MAHSTMLEQLLLDADKATDELREVNPEHEYLQYCFENETEEERDRLTLLFFKNFGPEGADTSGEGYTETIVEYTFGSYLTAVQAAIVVEKAKAGFYGSH